MVRKKPVNENEPTTPPTPPAPQTETPPKEPSPTPHGVTNIETLTGQPTDPAQHDKTDVPAALQRETQDGKGPDPIPESDFDSFATNGVEIEESEDDQRQQDLEDEEEVASKVLAGKWGAGEEKRRRLAEAGYDPSAIAKIVNRRLASGAATAFPTTVRDDATAVIRGEWGSDEDEIKRNLDHAGKNVNEVWEERNRQLGL